jgi:hypothetical protein
MLAFKIKDFGKHLELCEPLYDVNEFVVGLVCTN